MNRPSDLNLHLSSVSDTRTTRSGDSVVESPRSRSTLSDLLGNVDFSSLIDQVDSRDPHPDIRIGVRRSRLKSCFRR